MAWNCRLAALAAISTLLISGPSRHSNAAPDANSSETTYTSESPRREKSEVRWIRSSSSDGDSRSDREIHIVERHHYNPEEFRQMMKAELEHVPSLNRRMTRLMDIQAERYDLQKQRRSVAMEKDPDRGAIIKKFHELLRRDMELSEESRKIVQEIVKDMPAIEKEIAERRDSVRDQLNAENLKAGDNGTSTPAAINLRRSQRYMDFLERKLKDLETRPERLDLLSRMLRGIPMDDGPPPGPSIENKPFTPEQRLGDLKQKRRHLQRQLREVDKDIQSLRAQGVKDDTDSSGTKSTDTLRMK